MKHPGSVRNFESVLRELAARGHTIHLAFTSIPPAATAHHLVALAEDLKLTYGLAPSVGKAQFAEIGGALRRSLDYLRYLTPAYASADKLRARAAAAAPGLVVRLASLPGLRTQLGVRVLRAILSSLERAVPPPAAVRDYLAAQAPDLVLVTPLVGIGSAQADLVRAAKAARIPTVFPVHSWDNLTNKGLVRDAPGVTIVWNEAQRREAVELHGLTPDRVVVSGAHSFDHWFEWKATRTRALFCADTGLSHAVPFLLYVCSSPFIAPDEVAFVRRWLAAIRGRGGRLEEAGVLVRPHPQNAEQWNGAELDAANVSVWPRSGEDPVDTDARRNYFDSIFHSAAVVGINTSALIEAAIVGRPVHTVLAPEFAATQSGTLHFHHLASETGHLHVARSLDEHAAQLEAALAPTDQADRGRAFLASFVRPHGLDRAAAPLAVDAIEREARREVPAVRHRLAFLVRPGLRVLDARLVQRRRRARDLAPRPS
jgi:hypothetical protein